MQSADKHKRKILITGVAGFIGFHLARRLLQESGDGADIVGIDNLNGYYDPALKLARLRELGVTIADGTAPEGECIEEFRSEIWPAFTFCKIDIADDDAIMALMARHGFDVVFHLAAQASARYSTVNPRSYLKSNLAGFLNVLEGCRLNGVGHLIFASSSSVYGMSEKLPYREDDDASRPVSLYAATKRSNELMAHSYAAVYGLPVTGLRFFSVYGPWGRPDMSPYLFADAILHGRRIKVYNHGDMHRDFTYIDDVVEAMARLADVVPGRSVKDCGRSDLAVPYRIYNVGNSSPVSLLDYISAIEKAAGLVAEKELLPMQAGDVYMTYSNSTALRDAIGFTPSTPLAEGIEKTIKWFKAYHEL